MQRIQRELRVGNLIYLKLFLQLITRRMTEADREGEQASNWVIFIFIKINFKFPEIRSHGCGQTVLLPVLIPHVWHTCWRLHFSTLYYCLNAL